MGSDKNKTKRLIDMDVEEIFEGIYGITKSTLGIDKADDEIIEKRKNICISCEYVIKNNNDFNKAKCSFCGCWLKHKVRLKDISCPKDFW